VAASASQSGIDAERVEGSAAEGAAAEAHRRIDVYPLRCPGRR
jgi:hypothetical protein